MDGRIGGAPVNGSRTACRRGPDAMAGVSRDRLTIDLRGLGGAVRAAAGERRLPVAAFARLTLAEACGAANDHVDVAAPSRDSTRMAAKLTLRLDAADADQLILKSATLGLSYGAYVGRLVRGVPLPAPEADRAADRAALMTSCDRLAQLSADLAALIRMLRNANNEGARQYRASAMSLATDVRRHLDLASQVIAHQGGRR